jgi:DNA-binding TFAR19-related protein (PDSD5 family)
MSEDDLELMYIKLKKMKELQKLLAKSQMKDKKEIEKKEVDDITFIKSKLTGRGLEVLEAALSQYPEMTREVMKYLAELYRKGKISGEISGEELYTLFYDLGMPVRLETSITYLKDGKRISISEKLKSKED